MSADLYAAFMAGGNDVPQTSKGSSGQSDVQTSHRTDQGAVTVQPSYNTPQREFYKQDAPPLWQRDRNGADVLFDADQPEPDDDFGEFESVGDSNSGLPQVDVARQDELPPLLPDLLGGDDASYAPRRVANATAYPQDQTVQNQQTKKDIKGPSWKDDWGDFEQTGVGEQPGLEQSANQGNAEPFTGSDSIVDAAEDDWEPFSDGEPEKKQNTARAPTKNVSTLAQPVQAAPSPAPSHVKPKAELALQVMGVYRTACRVVAGRSLRWKRDTILAQSVRIGQAGKSGGMKLASLNKNESAKELRDAEEMIHDWSNYLHEFKSILAQAHFPPHRLRISSTSTIQTLKYTSGKDSTKQCAVCGLRRTERLPEVDVDADDIFGEFWTEHWGHKECYDFWYTYKELLGHR
ncbi:hypothetical protein HRR78_005658 [Exophiala dermatitidis]|nr:hypothetical protein HRR75_005776 [Exophiala dermatitidis]KAJ4546657.1 hypothetical protein HRR78_005658 [Exophiala dermatitidis]